MLTLKIDVGFTMALLNKHLQNCKCYMNTVSYCLVVFSSKSSCLIHAALPQQTCMEPDSKEYLVITIMLPLYGYTCMHLHFYMQGDVYVMDVAAVNKICNGTFQDTKVYVKVNYIT